MSGEHMERLGRRRKPTENSVTIRVWAPGKEADPEGHKRMETFADNAAFLKNILSPHGVLEADISPPMPTDNPPDGDTHYHLSLKSPITHIGPETEAIQNAIKTQLDMTGNIGSSMDTSHLPALFAGYGFSQMPIKSHANGPIR